MKVDIKKKEEAEFRPQQEIEWRANEPYQGTRHGKAACKLHSGGNFHRRIGGALWGFCPCTIPLSVMEFPEAASLRMTLVSLLASLPENK
jgi:hypothetical protein